MNTPPPSAPAAPNALSDLLAPVTAAQQALDAASEAFHAAQQRPWNALRNLIDAGTDFGHPLMPIVLARVFSSVGSSSGFLHAATRALETLRLIETLGTEFCIACLIPETHTWRIWLGTCSGEKIGIARPSGDDPNDARDRITFPFNVISFGHNQGATPAWAVTEKNPSPAICNDTAHSVVSHIAGASPIACNCMIAFGAEQIAAMTDPSNEWDSTSLARSVVACGREAASA